MAGGVLRQSDWSGPAREENTLARETRPYSHPLEGDHAALSIMCVTGRSPSGQESGVQDRIIQLAVPMDVIVATERRGLKDQTSPYGTFIKSPTYGKTTLRRQRQEVFRSQDSLCCAHPVDEYARWGRSDLTTCARISSRSSPKFSNFASFTPPF